MAKYLPIQTKQNQYIRTIQGTESGLRFDWSYRKSAHAYNSSLVSLIIYKIICKKPRNTALYFPITDKLLFFLSIDSYPTLSPVATGSFLLQ